MNVNSEPFVPRFTQNNMLLYYPTFTYQPLGVTSTQEPVVNDTAWTPVWSDMFQLAEQERIQREIQLQEQDEAWKSWYNQMLCAQRNLVHVRPERQNYCNVDRLEAAAVVIHNQWETVLVKPNGVQHQMLCGNQKSHPLGHTGN